MKQAASLMLVASALAAPCRAQPVAPERFALGVELEERRPGEPVQTYTLPERVLARVTDRELADLCVFDARGRQLAHAISRSAGPAMVAELPLPYFPLETREQSAPGVLVSVERDARGAIKRAFSRPNLEVRTRLLGYLIEHADDPRAIEALTLSLTSTRAFAVRATVEASDDLSVFQPLATATLARLEHDGHTLRRDLIPLPATGARYLRLSFADPPDDLVLSAVSARVRTSPEAPARRTLELGAEPLPASDQQRFLYELKGAFQPDHYALALPPMTVLVEAVLSSGAQRDGPFRELDRGLFQRDASAERALPATLDRFFLLTVAQKGGGLRQGTPTLRFGYSAPRLLFSAAEAGPYLLAYGSATARCERFDEAELGRLARGAPARDDTVRALRVRRLAGERALRAPTQPLRRVYVLWAVLLAAVAALAWVARKLLRQV